MQKILVIAILISLFLVGCSTKREYFKPAQITSKISYTATLPSYIKYTTRNGATLNDGSIITKDGLKINSNLDKNDIFLGEFDKKLIISDIEGNLKILENNKIIYTKKFPQAIISASLQDNNLAAVGSNNTIYLININNNTISLEYNTGSAYAIDSRAAAPIFLNSIIIYPTLDGKIMVVDKSTGHIIRDAVVSSEPFFNNIIFLDVANDKMFAATATKLIMISPQETKYYNGQIKDVLLHKNRLYIFLKDGGIEVTDLELNKITKKDFTFAIFSNAIFKGDFLYIIEKTGYFIKTDPDLKKSEIMELNSQIKDKTFVSKDTFFYDNKMLKLN